MNVNTADTRCGADCAPEMKALPEPFDLYTHEYQEQPYQQGGCYCSEGGAHETHRENRGRHVRAA